MKLSFKNDIDKLLTQVEYESTYRMCYIACSDLPTTNDVNTYIKSKGFEYIESRLVKDKVVIVVNWIRSKNYLGTFKVDYMVCDVRLPHEWRVLLNKSAKLDL